MWNLPGLFIRYLPGVSLIYLRSRASLKRFYPLALAAICIRLGTPTTLSSGASVSKTRLSGVTGLSRGSMSNCLRRRAIAKGVLRSQSNSKRGSEGGDPPLVGGADNTCHGTVQPQNQNQGKGTHKGMIEYRIKREHQGRFHLQQYSEV